MLTIIAWALAGGLLNRLRGGLLNDLLRWGQKTQASRLAWALPTGLASWYVLGGPWWLAVAFVASTFGGQAFFGNGGYLYARPIRFPDWLGIARNFVSFFPAIFVSHSFPVALMALGSLHAAGYWLAFRLGGDSRHGEVIIGAATWAAIFAFRI